jgi:hypothetical protein
MRFYVHLERNSKITSRRNNYSNIQHEMLNANAKVNTPPCKLTYFSAEVYMSSYTLRQCFSNCGPRRFVRWSADGFGRKSIAKIVSDTKRMKNTPIHVCAKTAFVG